MQSLWLNITQQLTDYFTPICNSSSSKLTMPKLQEWLKHLSQSSNGMQLAGCMLIDLCINSLSTELCADLIFSSLELIHLSEDKDVCKAAVNVIRRTPEKYFLRSSFRSSDKSDREYVRIIGIEYAKILIDSDDICNRYFIDEFNTMFNERKHYEEPEAINWGSTKNGVMWITFNDEITKIHSNIENKFLLPNHVAGSLGLNYLSDDYKSDKTLILATFPKEFNEKYEMVKPTAFDNSAWAEKETFFLSSLKNNDDHSAGQTCSCSSKFHHSMEKVSSRPSQIENMKFKLVGKVSNLNVNSEHLIETLESRISEVVQGNSSNGI